MRKLLPVVLAAGMMAWGVTPPKLTEITVHIVNDLGKPVDQAEVIVRFYEGRNLALMKVKKSWEQRSSQEGLAKFPSIPQGHILVQVVGKNYQTFGEYYDIHEDEKTVEVQLKPPQAQYTAHPGDNTSK